jgi:hypothetical protein
MIFADYPGHLVAAAVVMISAAFVFIAFYASELRRPERKAYRWFLMLLQYTTVLLLLVILLNPSRWRTTEVFARNAVLTLFDTSRSMSIADDKQTARLDKAVGAFTERFRPLNPTGPEYQIYGFDRHAYHCGSADLLRRWGSETDLQTALSLLAQFDQQERSRPAAPESNADAGKTSASGLKQPTGTSTPGREPEPRQASLRPAGAIIFTDGQADNKNIRSYQPLLDDDLPIILVGVGSRKPGMDIVVKSISAPTRVWVDTAYTLTVALAAKSPPNGPVTVQLLDDGRLIDSRRLDRDSFIRRADVRPADPELCEATVEFIVPAQRLGTQVLTARAKPHHNEVNVANNSRNTSVEVTQERTISVLLYSQWANFDIGKIRQSLAWDKRIHLELGFDVIADAFVADRASQSCGYVKLPESKEEFSRYDVIILGPCDLSGFTQAQVRGLYSFVAERGGGLVLLPGRTVMSLTMLQSQSAHTLLPVFLDSRDPRFWPPEPNTVDLTFEAQVSRIFSPAVLEHKAPSISPYYEVAGVKPASTTLVKVDDVPVVSAHRLGRGRACLLNASKLFMLYREDEQGGFLSRLISGLVAYLGMTPSRGAGVELFAERSFDNPRQVVFSAHVVDKSFKPVSEANVLLDVGDDIVSMEPAGQGRYTAEIDHGSSQSVVATAQAELNGLFLGQRTIARELPPVRDEMSEVGLDERFLADLARRLGGKYIHIDDVDDKIAETFTAVKQIGTTEKFRSVWPTWPLFLALCLLLSIMWFVRRAIGLV